MSNERAQGRPYTARQDKGPSASGEAMVSEAPDDELMPVYGRDAFHCPGCGAYADQKWGELRWSSPATVITLSGWSGSYCARCQEVAMWKDGAVRFPAGRVGPRPHGDMPDDVRAIYEEAQDVTSISRKSAAALLRLAVATRDVVVHAASRLIGG